MSLHSVLRQEFGHDLASLQGDHVPCRDYITQGIKSIQSSHARHAQQDRYMMDSTLRALSF